jgi:hypothetical protein
MRRRTLVLGLSVGVGVFALLPPVSAQVDYGPPPDLGAESGGASPGFFGFSRIETVAQGQMGTGYFFAVGDEVNRIVGARVEIVGPPTNSRSTAAFIQRGIGATYVYGVAGGPGGTSGALPDPPPGEAPAYWPTDPHESTFEGPVTAALDGSDGRDPRTVDGRFHATATEDAEGLADAAVTRVEVPGYFTVERGSVISRSTPVPAGVEAESVSVLQGLTVGPLTVDTMISRAYGFVPSAEGEPRAVASTVVEGATVGKVPVRITDSGVVVADQSNPGLQEQVKATLAQAGMKDVRLLPSLSVPEENGERVTARAGTLEVVHRDEEFGAGAQGFKGGGFAVGGAEVRVVGKRCDPPCVSSPGETEAPGLSFEPPTPADGSTEPSSAEYSLPALPAEGLPGGDLLAGSVDGGLALDQETGVAFLDPTGAFPPGGTLTLSSDATPEVPFTTVSGQATAPAALAQPVSTQAALAAASGIGAANEFRRIFLALAGAVGVVVVARGLIGAPLTRKAQP